MALYSASRALRYFSIADGLSKNGIASPWRTAFPHGRPLGYYDVFEKRCAKLVGDPRKPIDEDTARKLW